MEGERMVEVLFFAELRDVVGKDKLTVAADGMTITELKEKWLTSYGVEKFNVAMVAINEEYAPDDTLVKAGDVIAFIPPVSGG